MVTYQLRNSAIGLSRILSKNQSEEYYYSVGELVFTRGANYRVGRPSYPDELLKDIQSLCPENPAVALDCGTGTGQVAERLREIIPYVIGLDISEKQLTEAPRLEGVSYIVGRSEAIPVKADSLDLLTVAAAYHWMDCKSLMAEGTRVLKKGGIFAIWNYSIRGLTTYDELDRVLNGLMKELEDHWPQAYKDTDSIYGQLEFPECMQEVRQGPPIDAIREDYTRSAFSSFIESLSGAQMYRKSNEAQITEKWAEGIDAAWGERDLATVTLPISAYRVAKKTS